LAVILIAAFWPVPIARWLGAGVNSLMVAATPVDGSHYFVDVFAGVVVAALCLFAARMLVGRMITIPSAPAPAGLTPAVRLAPRSR
jgi:membrane-associated phospholipid phosphatase